MIDWELFNVMRSENQVSMSDFQNDYFVILKAGGPTAYGQYKLAVREMMGRYGSIQRMLIERENMIASLKNPYPELVLVEKREALFKLDASILETKRAFYRFYQHASRLKELVGPLTPEKRYQYEREFFEAKFKEMIAVDVRTGGRLGSDTYRAITSLPKESKDELMKYVRSDKHIPDLLSWYENDRHSDWIQPEIEYHEASVDRLLEEIK